MIDVDGAQMEGGGQLLRMATAYACITGTPIRVFNIRGKRRNPGLRPQHRATLRAAVELCSGKLNGAELGSTEITLNPGSLRGGVYTFDIGTAGSISLMLQCLTPLMVLAPEPVSVTIRGGTDVRWSPTVAFVENVVYKAFSGLGARLDISINKHGFYPKGGGEVTVNSMPVRGLKPIQLGSPRVDRVRGVSVCGNLPAHIAERQAKAAEKALSGNHLSSGFTVRSIQSPSPGSSICLWAEGEDVFMGADSLGERGKPAEVVGKEAAESLMTQIRSGANVDMHTGDHLILPLSLADGVSRFTVSELTLHATTAIELAKTFTECKVEVDGKLGKPADIEITGARYGS